jgi:hypothetical protein
VPIKIVRANRLLFEDRWDEQEIAQFAQRKAQQKIPELIAALQRNRLTDHHRFLLRQVLRHLDFLAKEIEALNVEIRSRLRAENSGNRTPCCNPSRASKKKPPPRLLPKLVQTGRSSHPAPTWHPGLAFAPAITKAPGYARLAAPIAAITGFALF